MNKKVASSLLTLVLSLSVSAMDSMQSQQTGCDNEQRFNEDNSQDFDQENQDSYQHDQSTCDESSDEWTDNDLNLDDQVFDNDQSQNDQISCKTGQSDDDVTIDNSQAQVSKTSQVTSDCGCGNVRTTSAIGPMVDIGTCDVMRRRDFRDQTLIQNQNFSNKRLSGCKNDGKHMEQSYFIGSSVCHSDLRRSKVRHCDFQNAMLDGANLRETYIRRSNFDGAHFNHSDVRDSTWKHVTFRNGELNGVQTKGWKLKDVDMTGTKLANGQTLKGAMIYDDQTCEYFLYETNKQRARQLLHLPASRH